MLNQRNKRWERMFGATSRTAANAGLNTIMVGIVKSNDDPQRMGRIRVWIPEMGGVAEDEGNWWICSYASPFGGATSPKELVRDGVTMDESSRSYGWWAQAPDLENQVLVAFVNGDPAKGYYFASIFSQNMNHMVPGIPSNVPTDAPDGVEGGLPPVAEYNRRSSGNTEDPPRPVFTPLHEGLRNQGLYSDPERGPSSAGSRREAPSKVFGFLTPAGQQVYADDNPENGYIRLRTSNGAQVMIHDQSGYVYINSKDGNSWIEISDDGIDVYSKGSISMRAEQDLNLHADRDVVIHAGNSVHAHANNTIGLASGGNTEVAVGGTLTQSAGGNATMMAGGDIGLTAGGMMASAAGGTISESSGGENIRSASKIEDNTVGAPASPAKAAVSRDVGTSTGVSSIANRTPTHEPWPMHPSSSTGRDTTPVSDEGPRVQTGSGENVATPPSTDTSPTTNACNATVSANVIAAIREASSKAGVDFGLMLAMANAESAFRPGVGASTSSAKGLYQFIDSTWESMVSKYGRANGVRNGDIYNARANAIMGGFFLKENMARLASNGLEPTANNLYCLHLMGPSGGIAFLRAHRANPNASVRGVVSSNAISANGPVFRDGGRDRTLASALSYINSRVGSKVECFRNRFST